MLKMFVLPLMVAGLTWGTSFSQCPAVGADTLGCELLITVTGVGPSGDATIFTVTTASPDQGPYDSSDDTLIGIVNNSGAILKKIGLSSSLPIFGFDGDGACTFIACPGAVDPSQYAPTGIQFSSINPADTSGEVHFIGGGLANGASTWFSLEDQVAASQILPSTPEPATFYMLGAGLLGLGIELIKRKK